MMDLASAFALRALARLKPRRSSRGERGRAAQPILHAAANQKTPSTPRLRTNQTNQGSVPQLPRRESNKQPKKFASDSGRWRRLAEFLESSPRAELKEPISLVRGTSTGDGRLMRAGAVPGMGLVTSSAGGSETRPAGLDAGLPGAGCPGSARRRYHEARDRTEPRPRGFGESRGRAPEGERVRQKRRAPR
jgi:hypothetical protein